MNNDELGMILEVFDASREEDPDIALMREGVGK